MLRSKQFHIDTTRKLNKSFLKLNQHHLKTAFKTSLVQLSAIHIFTIEKTSLNLQQHCRLDMTNALEEMEHSHNYLYVHHNQSLLYNIVMQQIRQLITAINCLIKSQESSHGTLTCFTQKNSKDAQKTKSAQFQFSNNLTKLNYL